MGDTTTRHELNTGVGEDGNLEIRCVTHGKNAQYITKGRPWRRYQEGNFILDCVSKPSHANVGGRTVRILPCGGHETDTPCPKCKTLLCDEGHLYDTGGYLRCHNCNAYDHAGPGGLNERPKERRRGR